MPSFQNRNMIDEEYRGKIMACNNDECEHQEECWLRRTHKYDCLVKEHGAKVVNSWIGGACVNMRHGKHLAVWHGRTPRV